MRRLFFLLALLVGCHAVTPREHALTLLARGQVPEGVAELERLRNEHPNDPRAWIDLGHGYELQHRWDDALAAYDEAARVAPEDPRGPREGGLRCAKWGEKEAARARLEEAVRRGDDEPATYHALGLVRLALGDRAGARQAYGAGLATPKGKSDATCVLGLATVAVLADDGGEALRWYDELALRRPQLAAAQLGRAWALAKLGRFADADAALEEAKVRGAAADEVAKLRAFVAERRAAK